MPTQVITSDALNLMNQFNQATKELAKIVDKLADKVAELKLDTVQPAVLTVPQAAKYLGVSEPTIRKWATTGMIGRKTCAPRFIKLGDEPKSPLALPVAEADRWIREDAPLCGGLKRLGAAA